MPRACCHLLLALAVLIALGWAATPAPAGQAGPHGVVVAAGHSHHGDVAAHCVTGGGASCQVPALTGAAFALLSPSVAARPALPCGTPGAALTRLGPRPPVPIG